MNKAIVIISAFNAGLMTMNALDTYMAQRPWAVWCTLACLWLFGSAVWASYLKDK